MSIDLNKYNHSLKNPQQIEIEEKTKNNLLFTLLNKDIQLGGKQLSLKKKEYFYTELEILLKAGLDLKTTLDLIEEGQINKKDQQLFAQIRRAVIQGDSLSAAMDNSDKFSAYEIHSIRIAEESGQLPPILTELALYFAKNIQYRRLLVSALSYPVLVISVSILALLFLLQFLVPLFGDIYARLDQDLPPITIFMVELSEFVQQYFKSGIIGVSSLVLLLFTQRKKDFYRKWKDVVLIHIPIFGKLIRQLYLARFCQAMAFLLSSKVPMLNALELIQKMVGFYPIEQSIHQVSQEILKGTSLHKSLAAFSIYPHRMIALVKVGEQANQLPTMFSKLAAQYNDEVEQQTKMLGSLIEPVLIVFLAIVVGLVLVAMYMPIFKLVTGFGV